MKFKIKNFRGSGALTHIEPTEKELIWLFNQLDSINKNSERYFSSVVKSQKVCEFCEQENQTMYSYRISTATITDVQEDDWDDIDRGLQLNICTHCHAWYVGDY